MDDVGDVRNTRPVTLSAQHLRLVLIALAVVIGFAIIYLFFASIAGRSSTGDEATTVRTNPDVEWIAERPGSVHVGLPDAGVDLACDAPTSLDEPVLVVGHNAGTGTIDYDVEVRLLDDDGQEKRAVAAFRSLRPGETRSVVPSWTGELMSINECSIIAVQTDRSVLLNSAADS